MADPQAACRAGRVALPTSQRGLDFVSIGRHADREAPATTERVFRTRGWEKDLAQGAVPLAGFLIRRLDAN